MILGQCLLYLARRCLNCHSLSANPSSRRRQGQGQIQTLSAPSSFLQYRKLCFWFPLTGPPRTFSSRANSNNEEESGIVFGDGGRKDEPDSSDDEDDRVEDELITSFNKFGIPSKPNLDWWEAARKRRAGAARLIPNSPKTSTGADGSVGGPDTRDTINFAPNSQLSCSATRKSKSTQARHLLTKRHTAVEEHAKI
ncbi:hypothetical protein F4604DRAFT_1787511 [Suillus subluteus]|nr:hypothetical protein F4604DRAFT_1787511 [Suillus subluteus]